MFARQMFQCPGHALFGGQGLKVLVAVGDSLGARFQFIKQEPRPVGDSGGSFRCGNQ
jgi:hypothetical protein